MTLPDEDALGRLQGVKAVAIAYEEDGGPGVFSDAAISTDVELEVWKRWESGPSPSSLDSYGAIVCLGGSMHPTGPDSGEPEQLTDDRELLGDALAAGTPILSVCLGAELCTQAAGGGIRKLETLEVGWTEIELTEAGREDPLLGPMGSPFEGFEWHSYGCLPPEGAIVLATNSASPQAWRIGDSAWAIQFHAEVLLEDIQSWLRSWDKDPDALASGLDPDRILVETERKILRWNDLGRGLAERFLAFAATRA
ncbi:MAG: type 1 glutamine amidotransferase [bacterium]